MFDELFCITLENITKPDARFYCKTYGLVYKPNRRKGFDIAGDEDSVREMLEDYIGRYEEIGRIMNEGWYVPDWQQDDFIDPNNTMLRKVGDGKDCYPSCSKKAKDSDPWHELAHYVLTFEDGHREKDTLPIYVRDQCSSDEEIIDMLQDYYDDKIVAIKQVGWSRMGDSKKTKDKKDPREVELERIFKRLESEDLTDNQRDALEEKRDYLREQLFKSKSIKDSLDEVPEGHREALEEYLAWEGIMGYDEDIIDVYESKSADIDDEYIEYDNSYDALDAYLKWEGILGYTEAIYDIIENGVESSYYDYMLREKEED